MPKSKLIEYCDGCHKDFDSHSKGSVLITQQLGYIKKTDFYNHDHFAYCPKCSKEIVKLLKH